MKGVARGACCVGGRVEGGSLAGEHCDVTITAREDVRDRVVSTDDF